MTGMIPENLRQYILDEAERSGYQVVDISTRGGKGFFLEIILDKEGGIKLDECGAFNRRISAWIDGEGLFGGRYTLDVCSPGLDRILRSRSDFTWASGKQVEVTTHELLEGKNPIIGKLLKGNLDEGLTLEGEDGREIYIDREKIARTRMHVVL